MRDVFVVVQSQTNQNRDFIVAVCASRQRAERYVDTTPRKDALRIEVRHLFH